jgi:hypothetical protein
MTALLTRALHDSARYQGATCTKDDYHPSMWDIVGHILSAENRQALQLCATCPVLDTCRTDAITRPHEAIGTVRGGIALDEHARVIPEQ